MDPNKPPNQIYGVPYSKVEYPVGMQQNLLGGAQQNMATANSSQLQYSNMLQMMYGGQNVLPLGLQPQLYQYHAALAGLNAFPGQFAGQMGQAGSQLLQQGGFQGFNPAAMGYGAYPFLSAATGLAGAQNGGKDGAPAQQYGQAVAAPSVGTQPSRARDEVSDKDKRQRSRDRLDREHNKKQKDQGKPREKDQPSREQPNKQFEGPGRQAPNHRGLSDSRQPQQNQHQQKYQHQSGGGNDFRNGPDRRHREDRDSREREKSRIREGRDGPGFGGGFGHNQGGNFQSYRRDEDRDNYRRDKDFRNNQGPPRHEQDRLRDQMPNRDRDRDQRREFERDRPGGDSWKNKDKLPDKPKDRDRDRDRERERDRDRERDRERQGRDNRPDRYDGRDTVEKESGSLGFREITKPMDNIEGNTIPKDRPVSYMCIESNVARKAVVIEMVKFKIGKYFLEDKAVQARQAAEGDEEAAVEADPERECPADDDEIGLSDEEDLYHLTFRKRYYNDSEICGACFKEGRTSVNVGHTEKSCPERFRSVCWMCLGNHNKDECVNIACFRCNGSGHKNSNCPMRDSNSIPFCQKCKKRSHLERDCSMLNLSFSKIIQEKDAQQLMICTYCGLRGHLPSIHFKHEMMDVEEQSKEVIEQGDVLHHTNSKSAADAEPQLDWQNLAHSDDGDEDALPSLYEPKDSMQRENSSVLRMLSRESAEKANPLFCYE